MLDSLHGALVDQTRDLYSAESQLAKALPRMTKAASSETLRDALTSHLDETHEHVERLREIAEMLECKPGGKKCKAMEGLVEEGKEVLEEEGEGAVVDLALIAAAQRVEHYEIAAYGSAIAMADALGYSDAAELFRMTLEEELKADATLGTICADEVLPAAAAVGEDEQESKDEEAGDERTSKGQRGKSEKKKDNGGMNKVSGQKFSAAKSGGRMDSKRGTKEGSTSNGASGSASGSAGSRGHTEQVRGPGGKGREAKAEEGGTGGERRKSPQMAGRDLE